MGNELSIALQSPDALRIALAADPSRILTTCGLIPDPWQTRILRERHRRRHVKVHRQGGKSTTIAALIVYDALFIPGCLQLIGSPTQRQSVELFRKVRAIYRMLARALHLQSARLHEKEIEKVRNDPLDIDVWTVMHMELKNGSRVVALPDNPDAVRGFSAPHRVVIDESAYTSDEFHMAVRPMLAVSGGELYVVSTPAGRRGYFWETSAEAATKRGRRFDHVSVPIVVPHHRIPLEHLEDEQEQGERHWRQEYLCEFVATDGAVFRAEDVRAAFDAGVTLEW